MFKKKEVEPKKYTWSIELGEFGNSYSSKGAGTAEDFLEGLIHKINLGYEPEFSVEICHGNHIRVKNYDKVVESIAVSRAESIKHYIIDYIKNK